MPRNPKGEGQSCRKVLDRKFLVQLLYLRLSEGPLIHCDLPRSQASLVTQSQG